MLRRPLLHRLSERRVQLDVSVMLLFVVVTAAATCSRCFSHLTMARFGEANAAATPNHRRPILTLLWLITEVYRRMVGGKDVLDAGGKDALDRFATTFDCVQPTALT